MTNPGENTQVLEDVLDKLLDDTGGDEVSVEDIVAAFQDRGFGALITIAGLLAAAPFIGAIPGMSLLTGALVLLIAVQFVVGRKKPWIPSVLRERKVDRSTLEKGLEKARPVARWVDSYVKPRLGWLIGGEMQRRILAAIVAALAVTMFPLALVPWGVLAPAGAVALFGISLLGRDGLFASLGYVLVGLTAYLFVAYRDTILTPFFGA